MAWGTPWSLTLGKISGKVGALAFVNFAEEMVVLQAGPSDGEVICLTIARGPSICELC